MGIVLIKRKLTIFHEIFKQLIYLHQMFYTPFTMKLLIFSIVISLGSSENILGFFHIPAQSHQSVFQQIWKNLALRGHNVTVLSPIILNESLTNLREIDTSFILESIQDYPLASVIDSSKHSSSQLVVNLFNYITNILEIVFQHESIRDFFNETDNQFDVIVTEVHSPIVFALGHKYKAPVVDRGSSF